MSKYDTVEQSLPFIPTVHNFILTFLYFLIFDFFLAYPILNFISITLSLSLSTSLTPLLLLSQRLSLPLSLSLPLTLSLTHLSVSYSLPFPSLFFDISAFTPHLTLQHFFSPSFTPSCPHFFDVGESERVRTLYSRLLERTSHVKVWLSYAQYEASEAKALLDVPTIVGNREKVVCLLDILSLTSSFLILSCHIFTKFVQFSSVTYSFSIIYINFI